MYTRTIVELEDKIKRHEMRLGPDHPKLLDTLNELAHLYFVFGRYDDAERLLWRSITICSKWYGQDHTSLTALFADLGYLYEAQEHWVESEHVYRLAYAIQATNYGHSHPEARMLARRVVRVCTAQDKSLSEGELEKLSSLHMVTRDVVESRGT